MKKYKLIFGVQDVSDGDDFKGKKIDIIDATGDAFCNVHELSQIIVSIDPAVLDKHMQEEEAKLPGMPTIVKETLRRSMINELVRAACEVMIRSASNKIQEHAQPNSTSLDAPGQNAGDHPKGKQESGETQELVQSDKGPGDGKLA